MSTSLLERFVEKAGGAKGMPEGRWRLMAALLATAGVLAVAAAVLTAILFVPLINGSRAPDLAAKKLELPPYNTAAWNDFPVLHQGRVKPFQTVCMETVRNITGRDSFGGHDAVSLVLTWRLLKGTAAGPGTVDWENYPFILCDHQGLREMVHDDVVKRRKDEGEEAPPTDWVHGKYVAPADLYRSPVFMRLLREAEQIREQEGEKAQHVMSPEQRKAEEVQGRLGAYYAITQNAPNLARQFRPRDPLLVVALDRVQGGAWFSVTQLKQFNDQPAAWKDEMRNRVAETPQRYIPPEYQKELEKFQERMKNGTAEAAVSEVEQLRKQEDTKDVADFRQRHTGQAQIPFKDLVEDPLIATLTPEEIFELIQALGLTAGGGQDQMVSAGDVADKLPGVLDSRNQKKLAELRHQVAAARGKVYHPNDDKFRMVHLNYLEARYPDLYRKSADWQEYPKDQASQVLASYTALEQAYMSGEPAQFEQVSQAFFATVRDVSGQFDAYPGVPTIPLELSYNRVRPFMWAWIIMLVSLVFFSVSLATRWRPSYVLAFAFFFASLAFQAFGFYTRIRISGRAPVSNMYETVVWVAFMSAVFALVLELVYRRRVIGLAGALVSTLGLVLADQLPLVLDPKLSPLVPVLRSNFWLTVHVLTIVSSYAGGTLAWGLGNISLALLAFGTPRRELLKTLSQYTYRAMQIAVLLLAVGTFLGAWWAADSWGRYWGWDPKEVWALIALVSYVIPLHMRYIGWVKDFGMAVSAVLCYAAIVMSWYGVNFVLGAGLHSYGFGGGGPWWVFWAGLLNIEWVVIASILYLRKVQAAES